MKKLTKESSENAKIRPHTGFYIKTNYPFLLKIQPLKWGWFLDNFLKISFQQVKFFLTMKEHQIRKTK